MVFNILTATGASINGSIVSESTSYTGVPLKTEIRSGTEILYANNQAVIKLDNSYTNSHSSGKIRLYTNGTERLVIDSGSMSSSSIEIKDGDFDIYGAPDRAITIRSNSTNARIDFKRNGTQIELNASGVLTLSSNGIIEVNCPDGKFLYNGKRVRTYTS